MIPDCKIGSCNSIVDTWKLNTFIVAVLLIPGHEIRFFVVVLLIPGRKIGSCNSTVDSWTLNTSLLAVLFVPGHYTRLLW